MTSDSPFDRSMMTAQSSDFFFLRCFGSDGVEHLLEIIADTNDTGCRRGASVAPDRSREVTVDREIVPLKHVADYAGGDDSVPGRGIHLIAPLIAVRGIGHNFEPR